MAGAGLAPLFSLGSLRGHNALSDSSLQHLTPSSGTGLLQHLNSGDKKYNHVLNN